MPCSRRYSRKSSKVPGASTSRNWLRTVFGGAFLAFLAVAAAVRPVAAQNITQSTHSFDLEQPIAPTLRWTMRIAGLCGQTCRNGPRHMYSTSVGDTLFLSWMSIKEDVAEEETGWVQFGNVATFQVSTEGEPTLVASVGLDGMCEAVYGITTNADGSLVSVLCEGYADKESATGTEPLAGAIDLLASRKSADCDESDIASCYPIGHFCPSASPMYILEYEASAGTVASVTSEPTTVIRVNHAVGGWRYGHHELSLNDAGDTYFLALKVQSNNCEHEGLTHFGVKRSPDYEYVKLTDGWACSGGHQEANRLAYNSSEDFWSIFCTNDLCDEDQRFVSGRCRGVDVSLIPGMSHQQLTSGPEYHEGEELIAMERWKSNWNLPGGSAAILSLGKDGWLALAPAPDPESPYEERLQQARRLGIIQLPVDGASLVEQRTPETVPLYGTRDDPTPTGEAEVYFHEWRWLDLPSAQDGNRPRYGFANMAHFGTEGENSERLLLGWSPATRTQGITGEYVVAEMDRSGRIRGEAMTLEEGGWGEDNRWTTMPNSGCVVAPFAWSGSDGPGQDYPIEGSDPSEYPTALSLTTLCPAPGSEQPPINEALSGHLALADKRGDFSPPEEGEDGIGADEDDAGGCACSNVGRKPGPSTNAAWWLLSGFAWLALRRGRRERRAPSPKQHHVSRAS